MHQVRETHFYSVFGNKKKRKINKNKIIKQFDMVVEHRFISCFIRKEF